MAATVKPATTLSGKRQAILHGLLALVAIVWPYLGRTHHPTPIEAEQLLVGIVGILVTYGVPELGRREAPYVKAGATALVAVATALVPALQGVTWHQMLTGATGAIVMTHLVAAIAGIVAPNAVQPGAEAYTPAPAAKPGATSDLSRPAGFDTTALTADPPTGTPTV